jgi:aldose 1-epimerase
MRRIFLLLVAGALLLGNVYGADALAQAVTTTPPVPAQPADTSSAPALAPAGVQRSIYGQTPDGKDIEEYTLKNGKGATAKILTCGATIAELDMPDREGKFANVVLAASSAANFLRFNQSASVMGRVANRIAGASFTLDGKDYTLYANDGPNTLHGGRIGFNKVNWTAEIPASGKDAAPAVKLTYVSKDGEEGFPGTLTVSLSYTLTDQNVLRLEYSATTDKPTPVNLTNHAYFNLAGGKGDSKNYLVTVNADFYTMADAALLPTGEIASVKGTPFDFTQPVALGARAEQLGTAQHYDASFVLNRPQEAKGGFSFAARVSEPTTGRIVEVWTDQPGLQIYTSQLGATQPGGRGGRGAGFITLETQHFPDAVHHANFPSIILRPGVTFTSETEYRFSAK